MFLLLCQIINRDLEGCEINLSAVIGTDMFHDQDKYEKYILSVSSVHNQQIKLHDYMQFYQKNVAE